MSHRHGECLTAGAPPCIDCEWYRAIDSGKKEFMLELSDDFYGSLQFMETWLRRPLEHRGNTSMRDFKRALRGLRFKTLRVGPGEDLGTGRDFYWAKLEHEGGKLFKGFGGTVIEALGDAVNGYLNHWAGQVTNKEQRQS